VTNVASHADQLGARDTHDHVWRRVSPENAQYGLTNDEYQCDLCALVWTT
jgi:hypothetical protein